MLKSIYAFLILILRNGKKRTCPECGRESLESVDAIYENDCLSCINYVENELKK